MRAGLTVFHFPALLKAQVFCYNDENDWMLRGWL